ncbi:RmlD substrate binding domain [Musa troglodytarum]|uniref:UDP-glucuronate decarboxylase n=1 Tax=Musa troglodytarum TaxID=320322 RepID=A0A9E7JN62_9LILI|nr:RmlD substrate binding domain [Musa troglodytarum]
MLSKITSEPVALGFVYKEPRPSPPSKSAREGTSVAASTTPGSLLHSGTRSFVVPAMASELIYRGHDAAHTPTSGGAGYSPKPEKRLLWFSRPLRYLIREQRLAFLLVGMVLATLFFALAPSSSSYSSAEAAELALRSAMEPARFGEHHRHRAAFEAATSRGFVGGKVPLGIKRKGLRIVVTGGAGFVGSHLVDRLIARGDSVIVVDNFFTGRKENVMHHFGNPNFELIRHDVVEPLLLEVDQIYHLACPASPVHYKFNPVKTIISFSSSSLIFSNEFSCLFDLMESFLLSFFLFDNLQDISFWVVMLPLIQLASCCGLHKTNVVGTLNMLGLAKRVGARFLLTSTSEVYGDPLQHPQVETYWGNVNPIGVRSCYDEGKRTAETLTMDYYRGAQVEVRIARIFNTYGPRMCIDDGRVVSNFVAQCHGLLNAMVHSEI